jgi:hypothetical protein
MKPAHPPFLRVRSIRPDCSTPFHVMPLLTSYLLKRIGPYTGNNRHNQLCVRSPNCADPTGEALFFQQRGKKFTRKMELIIGVERRKIAVDDRGKTVERPYYLEGSDTRNL